MFLPIAELPSSWLMTSHSSLWETHFGQHGGWSKPLILSSSTPTGMAEWREYMYMMQNRAHRLTSSQSLKVTLVPPPGVMPSTPETQAQKWQCLRRGLKKPSSDLQKEEEHLHSGCRTTIWQMRSRSLSELSNLQTTMRICLALLPRCFTSFHHQYTKGSWLELIKELKTLSANKDTLERLLANVKNVVLYSSHQCLVRGVTSALSRH